MLFEKVLLMTIECKNALVTGLTRLVQTARKVQIFNYLWRVTFALLGVPRQAGVVSNETKALQLRNLTELKENSKSLL